MKYIVLMAGVEVVLLVGSTLALVVLAYVWSNQQEEKELKEYEQHKKEEEEEERKEEEQSGAQSGEQNK